MMNYEIFKEVVKDSFKDYLPEQYKDMELRVCSVNKVNRMMDGINLIGGSEVKNVSPTIYINDMYDHYKACPVKAGKYGQLKNGRGHRCIRSTAPLRNQYPERYGTDEVRKCGYSF